MGTLRVRSGEFNAVAALLAVSRPNGRRAAPVSAGYQAVRSATRVSKAAA